MISHYLLHGSEAYVLFASYYDLVNYLFLVSNLVELLIHIFLLHSDPVDLAILLGSSEPNAGKKFKAQKVFVKKIVGKFDISRKAMLPAFVSLGPIPTAVSKIGEVTERLMAARIIDGMRNSNDSSDMSSALKLVKNYVFSTDQGARPNVPKSILMFVDKKNTGDSKVLNQLAAEFKKEETKLVVIGLGDEVDKEALKPLVHKNGAVFFPPTLDELDRIIEPVYGTVKPGSKPFHSLPILVVPRLCKRVCYI